MRKVTTDEFIAKAREVHGDKYDYSRVDYLTSTKKVTIVCAEHGSFEQTPANHANNGRGCPDCGRVSRREKRRSNTVDFISKARREHGEKYGYSRVEYVNNRGKIIIVCPEHGEFTQEAASHLQGAACPNCAGVSKGTTKAFIEAAQEVHGAVYDYSEVDYSNAYSKVTIICPEHGKWQVSPTNFLSRKSGCPICGGSAPLNAESFIARAQEIHEEQYDYSDVIYKNARTKITVRCPKHGTWSTIPDNHLKGVGCPGCADYGFDQTAPAIVYYVRVERFNQRPLYKIGVTNGSIESRFPPRDLSLITALQTWSYERGSEAVDHERAVLQEYMKCQYLGPKLLESGNSELFTKDVLELDIGQEH